MRVRLDELRRACEVLFAHLEASGQRELDIDQEFYWWVPRDAAYNPYTRPSELSLGQLSDDWRELSAIAEGRREALGYALVWLSTVLRAVGEDVQC